MKLSRASVGLAIRAARDAAGLTLKDLSGLTGVTLSSLSRTESGLRDVEFAELVAISNAVKIGVDDLRTMAESCELQGVAENHKQRTALEEELLKLQQLAIAAAIEARALSDTGPLSTM